MSDIVLFNLQNRVATITLNRPDKRNALNSEMVNSLKEAVNAASASSACKIILIKANGKAFCAGADLEYLQQLQQNTREENLADSQSLKELFLAIHQSPKIVIAQIEGHALAGGCGLASVCDFSYAVPDALFGYTEVKIGFIPALVMVFLLRKIGEGKSRNLLLTGDLIDASAAASIGLISSVIEAGQIETYVSEKISRLLEQTSANSAAVIKQMIIQSQQMPLEDALNYAASQNAIARESEDCRRGIKSFLNKEQLQW